MPTTAADPTQRRAIIEGCRRMLADLDDPAALDLLAELQAKAVVPLEPPRRLSQTLLSTFDACNLSARFYLAYEQDWSTHPQTRGQVFHRVAARCLELMAEYGEPDKYGQTGIEVEQALEVLDDCLRMADLDRDCRSCGAAAMVALGHGRFRCGECGREFSSDLSALPAEEIAQLRISVKTWAHNNRYPIENLVAVEERIRVPLAYGEDRTERVLSGIVDALFFAGDRAIVLDWKDTWALPPETELSFGGYFQQRFYAFLVMSKYPSVESVTLREHYVRHTEFREATIDRDQMDDLATEFAALAERFDLAFAADSWKPSPGKHCSYCPRPTACPIFPDARGEGAIQSAEEARVYGAQALVAKVAYDSRRKQLKSWADVHGDVPLASAKGPQVWGYVPATRTESPKPDDVKREIALAQIEGRPPNVDDLWRTKTGTKFDQHAPKPVPVTDHDRELERRLRESLDRADPRG